MVVLPHQKLDQRGFACAVVAEDDDSGAFVDGQVDAGEHDVRPVGLRDVLRFDGGAAAGGWFGEADVGDFFAFLRGGGFGEELFRSAHHVLRGHGLGSFGVQADALLHEAFGFLLRHFAFAAAAFLIDGALVQVGGPSE